MNQEAIIKENLSKWDELCPLNEEQLTSIILLSQLNQFQLDIDQITDEFDLVKNNTFNDIKDNENLIHKEINELLYNFDINDIEDVRIEKYVNNLSKNSKKCLIISELLSQALDHLNTLSENYLKVSNKTKSLHVACEQLLNDQVIPLVFVYFYF